MTFSISQKTKSNQIFNLNNLQFRLPKSVIKMNILAFYIGMIGVQFVGDIANNPDAFKNHPDMQASQQAAVPVDQQGISLTIQKVNQIINFNKDLSLLCPNCTQSVNATSPTATGLMAASESSVTSSSITNDQNSTASNNYTKNSNQSVSNLNTTEEASQKVVTTDGGAENKTIEQTDQNKTTATDQNDQTASGDDQKSNEEGKEHSLPPNDSNSSDEPSDKPQPIENDQAKQENASTTEKTLTDEDAKTSEQDKSSENGITPVENQENNSNAIPKNGTTEVPGQVNSTNTNQQINSTTSTVEPEPDPEVRRLNSKQRRSRPPYSSQKTLSELLAITIIVCGYCVILYLVWKHDLLKLSLGILNQKDLDFSEHEPITSIYIEMPTKIITLPIMT